ncbi:MAG: HNH endonuclease [Cyanobacteria bacterium REEB459]|nr:HNH endonuclease [Cyanobacteria bacterium REEB459]
MALIPPALRQQVIAEAHQCCEYCQTQQQLIGMPLVIDHIIPRSLGGRQDRATVDSLKLNNDYVVESRRIWVAENWHPPDWRLGDLENVIFGHPVTPSPRHPTYVR